MKNTTAKETAIADMQAEGVSITVFHYGIDINSILNPEIIEVLEVPQVREFNGRKAYRNVLEINVGITIK